MEDEKIGPSPPREEKTDKRFGKVGRRAVIKAGVGTAAGLVLGTTYVKPAMASIVVQEVYAPSALLLDQAVPTPDPMVNRYALTKPGRGGLPPTTRVVQSPKSAPATRPATGAAGLSGSASPSRVSSKEAQGPVPKPVSQASPGAPAGSKPVRTPSSAAGNRTVEPVRGRKDPARTSPASQSAQSRSVVEKPGSRPDQSASTAARSASQGAENRSAAEKPASQGAENRSVPEKPGARPADDRSSADKPASPPDQSRGSGSPSPAASAGGVGEQPSSEPKSGQASSEER